MITYRRCTPNDIDLMFEAFNKGFSDYMIKLEFKKENFVHHFFTIEQNQIENSLLALDDEKPIGIMLGGIKVYEGINTLRCGTLAIDPAYRKQGIAKRLFEMHKDIASENHCKQLFLEVIKGNDKAMNFYLKHGYEINHDLNYFSLPSVVHISKISITDIKADSITLEQVIKYYDNNFMHINWQNDFDYQKLVPNITYFGAFKDSILIGVLAMQKTGKIFYMHVDKNYRLNGVGKLLLHRAIQTLSPTQLSISFTNNSSLSSFVRKLGFEKQALSQHELYLPL